MGFKTNRKGERMKTRLLFAAASAVLMAGALRAQQQPNYYQTVNCIKVTDGKFDEYRQFINDAVKPMMQARANAGEIVAWSSMRSVMPAGTEARCDYRTVTLYDGVPPAPRGGQGLTDSLKAAGVKMTAAEYVAKRNSVSHLVAAEMWRSRVRVGQPQKGNYLFLNHMKVHDAAAYTKFETEVWRPLAEEWVKEGDQTGWVFNTLVLPSEYLEIVIDRK